MSAALRLGAIGAFLDQVQNVGQMVEIGQSHVHQQEQIRWARRAYQLESQSVRLDVFDHVKEEIRSHHDTYMGRIDALLLVLALVWPFGLNTIQFSDPFVPQTEMECEDCIEVQYTWLVGAWIMLLGMILILPFWGILMLIRCKLKLDRWLEYSLARLNQARRGMNIAPPKEEERDEEEEHDDTKEFGEDRGPEPQEAAEDVLNGSVNGGSARSVSWADQWTAAEDRDRGGGADKILVPEFSAEDDRELDVEWLDGDSGMDYFIDWIRNRYLDREVIKVGKYMTDFFKNLKKHNNQDVKEFNQEFDRQAARLKEVGCALPDVCLAWWYMDKLRLDNATELNLLSSTGNDYNLYKLQDAAIIQDRMNRRLWESHRGRNNDKYDQNKKGQQAYVTEELGEGQSEDEESELDMDVEGIDEEAEEAYVTYQNAKSKYRTIMNARGINPKANQEERIKAAKARSYCSACKKKGHWHKDPECPLNQKNPQGDKRDAHQVKFCHVAYMTDSTTETELYGITDCACSRTVAGRPWIRRMVRKAKENNIPYFFMAQEENFKFGGPDIFRSERALVVWLQINGAPFILKIAEVQCVLPLLLSRNVLAGLGMCYDISKHVADFSELGVAGYKLGQWHLLAILAGGRGLVGGGV
ncbi:unnamed protein product [Effrenium voratum]|nr:unnamed protein product [Effrenium voratum]